MKQDKPCKILGTDFETIQTLMLQRLYYGFGLNLDTRDSNAYVSRAKRTRCYAETATFPRGNFLERK